MRNQYSSTDSRTRIAIAALLHGRTGPQHVLELGAHVGGTSLILLKTLSIMGGSLTIVESDRTLIPQLQETLEDNPYEIPVTIYARDAMKFLQASAAGQFTFVYVDDNHDAKHVAAEIPEIKRVCTPDGFVTFHDMHRPELFALVEGVGGMVLNIGDHGLGLWKL
jgi:predicted O-methyltransferase YrrM